VNESTDRIARAAAVLALSAVQLHGEETGSTIRALRSRLAPGCEIWKAVRVRDRIPTASELGVDRVLLDGWHPDQRGGTGRVFDWNLLDGIAEPDRYVLSGGLKPANVSLAASTPIEFFDVNSGVETVPGEKSALALARFFAARRESPGHSGALR
jgi:indole-3-glycerol phosphate synthase/phosphoribosylanthranilate isomerase